MHNPLQLPQSNQRGIETDYPFELPDLEEDGPQSNQRGIETLLWIEGRFGGGKPQSNQRGIETISPSLEWLVAEVNTIKGGKILRHFFAVNLTWE